MVARTLPLPPTCWQAAPDVTVAVPLASGGAHTQVAAPSRQSQFFATPPSTRPMRPRSDARARKHQAVSGTGPSRR